MELLIKNSTIVTSTRTFKGDILITEGKIKAIGESLRHNLNPSKVVDATGKLVFPGGIDPHVHMHLPTPAGYSSDDFFSGSRAALAGGTSIIIDFVTPSKGESMVDALKKRISEASNSLTNYSFHVSPVEWRNTTEQEINECIRLGFPSFKVYMAYKSSIGLNDDILQQVLTAVGKAGGMVTVHAEMGDEIEMLRNKFVNAGKVEPKYHPLSRPPKTESDAVKRIIGMARVANCPLYIVHVSTKESVEIIKQAKANGQIVYAETCPQYLLLDDSVFEGSFDETSKFVLSPPLRKREDSVALWNAIANGVLQTVGTDHCPFSFNQKLMGQHDFRKIPNGAGGVEHRLALLYTFGVLEKKISINRFVDIISTQPAKIFGLYPRKGEIAVGSDADLVIWDPEKEHIISAKTHHSKSDLNIFEGFRVIGAVDTLLKNGEIIDIKSKSFNHTGELLSR